MKKFFNQCMLFKSKDKIEIILGLASWICIICIFLCIIILTYLLIALKNIKIMAEIKTKTKRALLTNL